jgi:hypothetical protein
MKGKGYFEQLADRRKRGVELYKKGWNQYQIAEALGVTQPSVLKFPLRGGRISAISGVTLNVEVYFRMYNGSIKARQVAVFVRHIAHATWNLRSTCCGPGWMSTDSRRMRPNSIRTSIYGTG